MFESLDSELLALSREGELWFQPNPGNAGDALIAVSAWQRFRRLGLHVRPVPDHGFDAEGKIVMYGGGGGLVPMYDQAATFIARHHQRARRFVLLPHTVDGREDLLSSLGPNCLLFCREPESLQHCRRHATRARVELSHDLVFGFELARFRRPRLPAYLGFLLRAARTTKNRVVAPIPGMTEARRILSHSTRQILPTWLGSPTINAFRSDIESARASLPKGNLDLSRQFTVSGVIESDLEIAADLLLRAVARHGKVRTDRLHVCIAGCLLGREVEFHPNSYFKCRAIWEHSIRGRYPKVRWVED